MAEYISRDDALLHSEIIEVYTKDYGNIDVVPVEYLADIPATDVQPIRHGQWIYVGSVRSWDELKCSACNSAFSTEDRDLILNWDFCPHCGARMDGEQND